jgi:hypothetical protein
LIQLDKIFFFKLLINNIINIIYKRGFLSFGQVVGIKKLLLTLVIAIGVYEICFKQDVALRADDINSVIGKHVHIVFEVVTHFDYIGALKDSLHCVDKLAVIYSLAEKIVGNDNIKTLLVRRDSDTPR